MFLFMHTMLQKMKMPAVLSSPRLAVLCLFHCSALNINELWFHTGTGKKRRLIPMHIIAEKLSEEIIRVLLAFHALIGCDSTSAPFGCGKKAAYCMLKGNTERFKELSNLGARAKSSNISEELMDTAIEFICSLHDQKNRKSDINSLRYKLSVKRDWRARSCRQPKTARFSMFTEQTINATYGRMASVVFLACPPLLQMVG